MFSDPVHILRQTGIIPGMDIADIGAGSGQYSLEAGKLLGLHGRVYAIDIQDDLLRRLKNEAAKNGLYNIEAIQADIEKKLPDISVHLAFMCNVLPHIQNPDAIISEVRRILYPQGRVLVVDWDPAITPMPSKIHKQHIPDMFNDFAIDREIFAGAHHYGFIFKKA